MLKMRRESRFLRSLSLRRLFSSSSGANEPTEHKYHRFHYGSLSDNGGAYILNSDHLRHVDKGAATAETASPIHHVKLIAPTLLFANVKQQQVRGGFEAAYADVMQMLNGDTDKRFKTLVSECDVTPRKLNSRFGVLVSVMYKQLSGERFNEDTLKIARILGWSVEFLRQSSVLIEEASGLRSSKRDPTEVSTYAAVAQNCSFSLLGELLDKGISANCYKRLLKDFDNAVRNSAQGRLTQVGVSRIPDYEGYTYNNYKALVRAKTDYLLPAMIATQLAELRFKDSRTASMAVRLFEELAYFAQLNRDFVNHFGSGSNFIDIRQGRLTWQFILAKQRLDYRGKRKLTLNYGRGGDDEAVMRVRECYRAVRVESQMRLHATEVRRRLDEASQLIPPYLGLVAQDNSPVFRVFTDDKVDKVDANCDDNPVMFESVRKSSSL